MRTCTRADVKVKSHVCVMPDLLGRVTCTECKDAACYYRCWMVCGNVCVWCVCLSVRRSHELCYDCWTDHDAVWDVDMDEPKEPCIRWGPDPPGKGAVFGWAVMLIVWCVLQLLLYSQMDIQCLWCTFYQNSLTTCFRYRDYMVLWCEGADIRGTSWSRHLPLQPTSDPPHTDSLLPTTTSTTRRKDPSLENCETQEETGGWSSSRKS